MPGVLLVAAARPRAAVAFHYAAVFSPRDLAWYTRFNLLVTGAILSKEQSQKLKRHGTKLIAYEWISGFYPGDAASATPAWQKTVKAMGQPWMLTDQPLSGGAAETGKAAHWYDFGNQQLLEMRAKTLAKRLAEAGYHGFFFDTPGFEHVPPAAQEAFRRRNPGVDYNERQGVFLGELRRLLPAGKIIFLNQGYRHASELLPHADMDLTESSFTGLGPQGSTTFRPWHDESKPWECVRTPIYELALPALRKFPKVQMVHVNYAAGSAAEIRRAHRYAYVTARILGHDAYLIVPSSARAEEDPIYFTELGQPEDHWREEPGGVIWRKFQHGIAAVNSASKPVSIPALGLSLPEPMQGYVFPRKS